MTWDEFVQKLRDAKKQKKNKGLSIPAITNLIFSGAFDDMIHDREFLIYHSTTDEDGDTFLSRVEKVTDRYRIYTIMYEEAKKALGSKASLPPKKKDDLMALADVKSDAQLQIWRHQINPTTSFSFVDECLPNLKLMGFERVQKGSIEALKKNFTDNKFTHETTVVGDWSKLPESNDHPIIRDFFSGIRSLGAVGVITDVKKTTYVTDGKNKEMIKVELFNGYGYIKDVILWPSRNGTLNHSLKSNLKKGSLGVLEVKLSINKKNGRRSFSIMNWDGFADG